MSDVQIAKSLVSLLTPSEADAIMVETGELISSTNVHIQSVMAKMMIMNPNDCVSLSVSSQKFIMLTIKKYIADPTFENDNTNHTHENIIDVVKENAEKKVGADEVAKKTDAYGNALFNALADIGYEHMDENNKRVADIGKKEGVKSMVSEMMKSSGGDYARMRMMYG